MVSGSPFPRSEILIRLYLLCHSYHYGPEVLVHSFTLYQELEEGKAFTSYQDQLETSGYWGGVEDSVWTEINSCLSAPATHSLVHLWLALKYSVSLFSDSSVPEFEELQMEFDQGYAEDLTDLSALILARAQREKAEAEKLRLELASPREPGSLPQEDSASCLSLWELFFLYPQEMPWDNTEHLLSSFLHWHYSQCSYRIYRRTWLDYLPLSSCPTITPSPLSTCFVVFMCTLVGTTLSPLQHPATMAAALFLLSKKKKLLWFRLHPVLILVFNSFLAERESNWTLVEVEKLCTHLQLGKQPNSLSLDFR
jgi:hypothetical protein